MVVSLRLVYVSQESGYLVFHFASVYLIRIRICESRGSCYITSGHVWTHTPVFSRFPSNVYVTAEYSSPCHQLHWPTEEDISVERTGDCVLVRGAASSTSSSRWSSCHGLINDSQSAEHQQLRAAHAQCSQTCPLNSSDDNMRWRQARVHNTFTRGRCLLAYEVT